MQESGLDVIIDALSAKIAFCSIQMYDFAITLESFTITAM
jgi:hypothetical protein